VDEFSQKSEEKSPTRRKVRKDDEKSWKKH
jgi:hypothetical protein